MASPNITTPSSTTSILTPSDSLMLDAFIPGYSFVSQLLSSHLHIDLSQYVPYIITSLLFAASARYTWRRFKYLFEDYCVSTAEIRLDDEIYNYLMYWMAHQSFTTRTTHFIAGTRTNNSYRGYYDDSDGESDDTRFGSDDEYDQDGNALAFDDYWAKVKNRDKHKRLRFTPSEGTHYFWFRGKLLAFIRVREDNNSSSGYMRWMVAERLYLSCFGRDPSILKALLEEAQRAYVARDTNNTVIYRGQKNGGGSGYVDWVRCMARAPRPLSTVVLDDAQKQTFVADIKEYLHPRTRRWYSNRGIPYRRGYLLHGPPGTGKTSLCFATAGLLGVSLYLLNLSSKSFDEDDLMSLFQDLPRRCIVLLEDVDCAGMTQKRDLEDKANGGDKDKKEQENGKNGEKKNSKKDDDTAGKGISLSGLLNVIDGVAASEGRILVMTTNHAETLDPALLRPGRVDMSINFGFADHADVKQLFLGIYSTLEGDLRSVRNSLNPRTNETKKIVRKVSPAPWQRLSHDAIDALGEEFATRIPEREFTAAEIQGHLLHHKTDPEQAVREVAKWVDEMRAKRKERESSSSSAKAEDKN
ncbi:hypothetical protein FE257_011329 [Aspergillus nanangensis]|uniref:Uncharacterized protein n=1 Tax=Aspergillus nanangensis TaxID=2582783 RepID=A0AAD4GRH4_ASPNN|nr:hypothetical protein FE257_011329 [Aspergillus nanangensis]